MSERASGAKRERDKPWIFRTYAGHSTRARVERALSQEPRQGADRPFGRLRSADPDRLRHRPSAGRAARSARSACRSAISATCARCSTASRSTQMNTSMTINAHGGLAAGALYRGRRRAGRRRAPSCRARRRTTSSRNISRAAPTSFRPSPRMRLITRHDRCSLPARLPKWNPMNVCSYHLQEAGATPVQELAFALATAIAVLDAVKASRRGRRRAISARSSAASRSSSTPASASSPRCARCARSPSCGTRSAASATASPTPSSGCFRYGVQVNSLGPHRAAAGEQRLPHPARDAGRDAVEERARAAPCSCRPGTRRSACRGLGPAMVAAPAADPRLRDRPARIRRHLRRLDRDRRARSRS